MKLYDVTHGTVLHNAALMGFLRVLRERADPATGLFPSSVSDIENATVPRGCALSWSASYLVQLEPAIARDQYLRQRDVLGDAILGIGGFREWPRGRGGDADLDSGPIVLGIGVAATGLGLGPARIFRDERSYTVIRRAALMFGLPAWWPSGGYWSAPLLGEAILFDGGTGASMVRARVAGRSTSDFLPRRTSAYGACRPVDGAPPWARSCSRLAANRAKAPAVAMQTTPPALGRFG